MRFRALRGRVGRGASSFCSPSRLLRRRPVLACVLAVFGAAAVWLSWPEPSAPAAAPLRARPYSEFNQCLLTDAAGLKDSGAASVWAGVERASAKTNARSQSEAIPAGSSAAEAVGWVNALIVQRCDVIVAVGAMPVEAAQTVAKAQPARRFLLVGHAMPAANVAVVAPGEPVPDQVAKVLTETFDGRFAGGVVSP